jgi:predicted ferric reductase
MRGVVYGIAGIVAVAIVGSLLGLVADGQAWMGAHGPWYLSRAAGFTAYGLLWVGLFGGLLMSSAWFDGYVHRGRLLAVHQVASIAGLVFAAGHMVALIPDRWTNYEIWHLMVPFAAPMDRSLNALGTLSLYLALIVGVSFWMRSLIGAKTFRTIHYFSFAAWGAALWHGMQLGTDSSEIWAASFYGATALLVGFATVLRVTYRKELPKRAEVTRERPARPA